jgi:hypothetical protein
LRQLKKYEKIIPMFEKAALADKKSSQTPSLKTPTAFLSHDPRQQATGNRQQATGNSIILTLI